MGDSSSINYDKYKKLCISLLEYFNKKGIKVKSRAGVNSSIDVYCDQDTFLNELYEKVKNENLLKLAYHINRSYLSNYIKLEESIVFKEFEKYLTIIFKIIKEGELFPYSTYTAETTLEKELLTLIFSLKSENYEKAIKILNQLKEANGEKLLKRVLKKFLDFIQNEYLSTKKEYIYLLKNLIIMHYFDIYLPFIEYDKKYICAYSFERVFGDMYAKFKMCVNIPLDSANRREIHLLFESAENFTTSLQDKIKDKYICTILTKIYKENILKFKEKIKEDKIKILITHLCELENEHVKNKIIVENTDFLDYYKNEKYKYPAEGKQYKLIFSSVQDIQSLALLSATMRYNRTILDSIYTVMTDVFYSGIKEVIKNTLYKSQRTIKKEVKKCLSNNSYSEDELKKMSLYVKRHPFYFCAITGNDDVIFVGIDPKYIKYDIKNIPGYNQVKAKKLQDSDFVLYEINIPSTKLIPYVVCGFMKLNEKEVKEYMEKILNYMK